MSIQISLKPKLRFPLHNEGWKIKRLGDLCSTFKSGHGITASDIYEHGEFPVFGGNGLRGFTNTFTHEGFYFLIGRQGALCGNINRVRGKSYISEHAVAVQGNDNTDTEWLAQRLDHFNLNRLSESSAQPGLSVGKLTRLKITLPAIDEQKKIADFLTAVDKRIQQLTQKKALLEEYKKGVMQQLFSQTIRFKDKVNGEAREGALGCDDGIDFPDWEEKKLGELVSKIGSGSTPTGGAKVYQEFGVYFIRSQNVNNNLLDLNSPTFISQTIHQKMKGSTVKPMDVLLNITGASIGRSCVVPRDFSTGNVNQHVCIIRPSSKLSPIFLQLYLSSFLGQKLISTGQAGGGREGLNFQSIRIFKIPLPSLKEQTKIANFLSAIDKKIENVNSQITETKTFKKGLLQQMFV